MNVLLEGGSTNAEKTRGVCLYIFQRVLSYPCYAAVLFVHVDAAEP